MWLCSTESVLFGLWKPWWFFKCTNLKFIEGKNYLSDPLNSSPMVLLHCPNPQPGNKATRSMTANPSGSAVSCRESLTFLPSFSKAREHGLGTLSFLHDLKASRGDVMGRQPVALGLSVPSPALARVAETQMTSPRADTSHPPSGTLRRAREMSVPTASHKMKCVSISLWPHGLWPTRLLCPWDFPGKDTGVGCHALLQRIFLTQG